MSHWPITVSRYTIRLLRDNRTYLDFVSVTGLSDSSLEVFEVSVTGSSVSASI